MKFDTEGETVVRIPRRDFVSEFKVKVVSMKMGGPKRLMSILAYVNPSFVIKNKSRLQVQYRMKYL